MFVAVNLCPRPPVPGVVLGTYEVLKVGLPAVPPVQDVVPVNPPMRVELRA
jgi:hypothetical protein